MASKYQITKIDGETGKGSKVGKAANPTRTQRRVADARAKLPRGSSDHFKVNKK